MVRMGSPVRFRRGAPPQTSSSGRVQYSLSRGRCVAYRGLRRSWRQLMTVGSSRSAVAGCRVPWGWGSADPVHALARDVASENPLSSNHSATPTPVRSPEHTLTWFRLWRQAYRLLRRRHQAYCSRGIGTVGPMTITARFSSFRSAPLAASSARLQRMIRCRGVAACWMQATRCRVADRGRAPYASSRAACGPSRRPGPGC